jgi:hypothetical protein
MEAYLNKKHEFHYNKFIEKIESAMTHSQHARRHFLSLNAVYVTPYFSVFRRRSGV